MSSLRLAARSSTLSRPSLTLTQRATAALPSICSYSRFVSTNPASNTSPDSNPVKTKPYDNRENPHPAKPAGTRNIGAMYLAVAVALVGSYYAYNGFAADRKRTLQVDQAEGRKPKGQNPL